MVDLRQHGIVASSAVITSMRCSAKYLVPCVVSDKQLLLLLLLLFAFQAALSTCKLLKSTQPSNGSDRNK
jgi:hypothetical protein